MSDNPANRTADSIKPLADALFAVIAQYQNYPIAAVGRTLTEVLGCVLILDYSKTGDDYAPDAIAHLIYMNSTRAQWMPPMTGNE